MGKHGENLKLRGKSYYAQVAVPRNLWHTLGKRTLVQALGTRDPATARERKAAVIAAMRRTIAEAKRGPEPTLDPRLVRALEIADLVGHVGGIPASFREKERQTGIPGLAAVMAGQGRPLGAYLDEYAAVKPVKAQSLADRRRLVKTLERWLSREKIAPLVENVTRAVAGRFQLYLLKTRTPRTVNARISTLGGYWRHMLTRGHIEGSNPWERLRLPPGAKPDRRAFTPEEIDTLFMGGASKPLLASMAIACLSGLRVNEMCRLSVADCADGVFRVGESKSDYSSGRTVPIHPLAAPAVAFLSEGRKPGDRLIPIGRGERKPGARLSKVFTKYRRKVGVTGAGVVWHSWRNTFGTLLEQSGCQPHIIARLMGHSSKLGISLSVYSAGASREQLAAGVAGIALPDKAADILKRAF